MAKEQNEDVEYNISDHAIPEPALDPEDSVDLDVQNTTILQEVVKYLEEDIANDRSTDSLDLTKDAPLSLEQQVFISKRDNARLRTIVDYIKGKIKEMQ